MAAAIPIDTNEYRVLLVDPESRGLCALERGGEYRLIRVAVAQRTRLARELQKTLRDAWGLAVLILDILTTEDSMSPCAVAELLHGELPAEFRGIQPEQLPSDELSEQERASFLAMLDGDTTSPLGGIGWIDEAIAWVETTTDRRVCSKSDVEQYNAGRGFTLVRLRMEHGCDYWLKATGAPNTHEIRVTSLLSKLCRGYAPEVVAERPAWNAWLMCHDGDNIAALAPDASSVARMMEGAVESLAELQIRTVGAELDLLEAGALDHRTRVLRADAEALFAYVDEAMGFQTSTKVARIEPKRLRELQNLFEDACSYMEDLGLSDTVLHGDMNLGNVLIVGERCVFIDWCEAYVGNPLVTFEHLLLLNQIEDPSLKASCNRRLRETYRSAMAKMCDSRAIDAGFACMPLIAAVSTILGRRDWLGTPERNDPRRQAYVRGIARHMDRAAREPALLGALSV
ncbi:phosphotransferase [Edaphobacter aggregans]|uniref:phosphotransferase n=1 Tax=Edaphobacter aggregans TaxID=570835 RepID=UPI000558CB8D|nr:phosphotransferase [Edaphobacter aggregans]